MTTIAIVGRGAMGRAHAAAWSELGLGERIRYIGVSGDSPARGTAARAGLSLAPRARVVAGVDEILADDEVDVVSICTPTPTHADIAIRALRAGKHVLLEKPIALTTGDAARIADAAAATDSTFMVAHVVRFFAGYQRVREQVRSGRLGDIRAVRAGRMSSATTAAWILDETQSGGPLVDFAIHDFDQLNLFLGTPVAVSARRETDGSIRTVVDYASGGRGEVDTRADLPAGSPFGSALAVTGTLGAEGIRFPDESPDSPYTRQAAYFLDCVRNHAAPEYCPTDAAVLALTVALAARASLQTGETVPVG